MFHPWRLPRDFADQIGMFPQRRCQFLGDVERLVSSRRVNRNNEFLRLREMLLVELKSLNGRLVQRKQIQHVRVESQPPEPKDDCDEKKYPPPAFQEGPHDERKPSRISPVLAFSKRQLPSGFCSK